MIMQSLGMESVRALQYPSSIVSINGRHGGVVCACTKDLCEGIGNVYVGKM